MKRHPRGAVYLNQRDIHLFRYLFENKVSTGAQIKRDLNWPEHDANVSRRLSKLVKAGYLQRHSVIRNGLRYRYHLTAATFARYIAPNIARSWKELRSDAPNHDLALVDIRHVISSYSEIAQYYTENSLQSELVGEAKLPLKIYQKMQSDAAVVMEVKNKCFNLAIEYEASAKSQAKYVSHLSRYYLEPAIDAILYIVESSPLIRVISQADMKVGHEGVPKVFFSTIENVLKAPSTLTFSNRTKDNLQIHLGTTNPLGGRLR